MKFIEVRDNLIVNTAHIIYIKRLGRNEYKLMLTEFATDGEYGENGYELLTEEEYFKIKELL